MPTTVVVGGKGSNNDLWQSITYLSLGDNVDVEVSGLLLAQLPTQFLHFAHIGLAPSLGCSRSLRDTGVKIDANLVNVLPRLAALCCLLGFFERVDDGYGGRAEVETELERSC